MPSPPTRGCRAEPRLRCASQGPFAASSLSRATGLRMILGSLPLFPRPPPLSWPRYDIFSGAVHINRPYGDLNIFHTGGSVVGVGLEFLVLRWFQGPRAACSWSQATRSKTIPGACPGARFIYVYIYIYLYYIHIYIYILYTYIYIYIYTFGAARRQLCATARCDSLIPLRPPPDPATPEFPPVPFVGGGQLTQL